ncbi:CRISPR-associated endonuclease Cas2 [Candidatus Curtissbacteria bacterium]|nr:CRISPR-associated endonuclease Cas2 [Candidatus Curtissbacteria bacterium]
MKLEKIQKSTLTKTVFATLAVGTIVGTLLVFPSLGYIIKYFTDDKNQQKYVKRVFHRLEKQRLISTHEKPDGKITITFTDKGKQKALTYYIDQIEIKRPKNWDGFWRVVTFDIPEGNKKARNIFRENLKTLGFYALQKSVFVHAFPCKDEIDFLKHNFGVASHVAFIIAKSIDNQNLLRNYFRV